MELRCGDGLRPYSAALLFTAWRGAAALGSTQAPPGAEANQLHAAIVNGDVESLRYWLETRHADASGANAGEPGVTPLARCLGLAAKVLDAPPASGRDSSANAPHVVSLRILQEMVMLLHGHGASLTDAASTRPPMAARCATS